MQYDAFVSYSHAADGKLAPALEAAVERFAKPWHRRRALHLFRDQTSLALTPELWPEIERALAASRFFLLLASPEAARSPWVAQEVGWWLAHKSTDSLLIVLTGGNLAWDHGVGDVDWARTDALPPNLRGALQHEPLWVDLRWAKRESQLSSKTPGFQDAVATVAAPLRGVPKEDLVGEDVRQHRRAMRLARGAAAVLALLAMVAIVGWIVAVRQQNEAERQRAAAEREAAIARSRALAAHSLNQLDGQLDLALLLALEATREAETVEAWGSVLTGVVANPQLSTFLHGGPGPIQDVAYSPDGALLAAANAADSSITLWDVAARQPVGEPLIGGAALTGLAFSPDGQILASFGGSGITLWDVSARTQLGPPLTPASGSAGVVSLAFSPDGATLAAASWERTVHVWDVAARQQVGSPVVLADVVVDILTAVAYSPSGAVLAVASRDGSVILWDVAADQPLDQSLTGQCLVQELAFSPDGRYLAAAGAGVIVWTVADWRMLGSRGSDELCAEGAMSSPLETTAAFSPDGQILATGTCAWLDGRQGCTEGAISLWSSSDLAPLAEPMVDHAPGDAAVGITSLAFSPDGTTLASGTTNKAVELWEVADRSTVGPLALTYATPEPGTDVFAVALRPDGGAIALAICTETSPDSGDCVRPEIYLRDAATGENLVPPLTGHVLHVTALAFSRDGTKLASSACSEFVKGTEACGKAEIRIWDVETGQPLGAPMVGHGNLVEALAFSPDGTLLASGGWDGTLLLWEVSAGEQLGPPTEAGPAAGGVTALAFAPDGSTVVSGSIDGGIVSWSLADGRPQAVATANSDWVLCLAFSPDGTTLASGGIDNVIRIWDAATLAPIGAPLAGHQAGVNSSLGRPSAGVFSLAFADGATLVSGGWDRSVLLWNLAGHQALGPSIGRLPRIVVGVAPSADGKTVVSIDDGGAVATWDIDDASWVDRACTRANRNLSLVEWERYVANRPYEVTCPAFPPGPGAPGSSTPTASLVGEDRLASVGR